MRRWWNRLLALFRSAERHVAGDDDGAADPLASITEPYSRMIEETRRGIASIVAAKTRLELQAHTLHRSAAALDDEAKRQLAEGQDERAEQTLARRAGITQELDALGGEIRSLEAQRGQLTADAARLDDRMRQLRSQAELLRAGQASADARMRVREVAAGLDIEIREIGETVREAEDNVLRARAKAAALDELVARRALKDPLADEGP